MRKFGNVGDVGTVTRLLVWMLSGIRTQERGKRGFKVKSGSVVGCVSPGMFKLMQAPRRRIRLNNLDLAKQIQ